MPPGQVAVLLENMTMIVSKEHKDYLSTWVGKVCKGVLRMGLAMDPSRGP